MVEVAVLYEELKLIRVPWDGKHELRHDGVVAIAICGTGHKRVQSEISHDFYELVWTDTDCCLTGHDGDYGFFSLTKLKKDPDWRFPFILPENCIEFEGVYVDKDEWQEALLIYSDPNGGMF